MLQFYSNTSIDYLIECDFLTFYQDFLDIVKNEIPVFEGLSFLHSFQKAEKSIDNERAIQIVGDFFSSSPKKEFYRCVDDNIYISVPTKQGMSLALISGVDPYFSKKVAVDWLENLSFKLLQKFLLIKRAGTDLETGLLNSMQFYKDIAAAEAEQCLSVMLIELYPRARSAKEARLHTNKVVNSFNNYLNGKIPLYFLGYGVFGLLVSAKEESFFQKLGQSLLQWLRRDGFHRVQIGFRNFEKSEDRVEKTSIVDEACFALEIAKKRGPYSICNYELLSHPEKHPLRRPSKSLLARFRKKWQHSQLFSVVQLHTEGEGDFNVMREFFQNNGSVVVVENQDLYVFLNDKHAQQALIWSTDMVTQLDLADVKVGICQFPHGKFSKSSTLMNCRKALHHATLLGVNGVAIFDSVSLNVSGDMYYSEGDINAAVKEYRLGLESDSCDVNLLNSLGVSYADMAKHRQARDCFEKVLSIDSDNFMALYNLGLGEQLVGNSKNALLHFEKAYELSSERNEDAVDDLEFQLGRLYCVVGSYSKAITFLQNWYNNNSNNTIKSKALPYIGRAFYGHGHFKDAMIWLQRALGFNEFDAESMGLLGMVYLLRQQGDDIALSLCQKSVDLDSENIQLKLYLAQAQMSCLHFEDAKKNLKKCLKNPTTCIEAQLLYTICYKKQGHNGRAKYWLGRLMKNKTLDSDTKAQAKKIDEELNGI